MEADEDEIVCEQCEIFDCGVHEGGTGVENENEDDDE